MKVLSDLDLDGNNLNNRANDPAGGAGAAPSFFQVRDDGSATQLTTGAAADLTGIWDTPEITSIDFGWDGASGVLTLNAAGTLVLDIVVHSWNNANNRHELHVILAGDTGSGFSELMEGSTYTSRNNTQDEGSVVIPGFKSVVAAGHEFKLQVFDVGVAASIGGSTIPGQTYISATLFK
ncbi:MAG: hypothetical protein AAFX44_06595 [Pseudomonadota bacterium]